MISESFLRNYNIKKILNAAQIEKEKLKVYYAKNIKELFKQHDFRINQLGKQKKPQPQRQVLYRYTVKDVKSDGFRDHLHDENTHYKGRPKVPLRCNELSLDFKSKAYSQHKDNLEHFISLFAPSPERILLKSDLNKTATTSQKRTSTGFRKKTYATNKNTYNQDSDILSPKLNDFRMDTKIEDSSQDPKICLENQEIVRCSSAKKIDNYLLFRQEALKKSVHRGQQFRKTIRQKFAKYGSKKQNSGEKENLQIIKK